MCVEESDETKALVFGEKKDMTGGREVNGSLVGPVR